MEAGPKITENEARYLKLIYRKQYEDSEKLGTSDVARSMGVRPATATEVIQNLSEKGLLKYRPYHGVKLTDKGTSEVRKLLRKHRLLEVFFAKSFDYDSKKACEEASRMDYCASKELINRICQTYGHPKTCPCDKSIFEDPSCKGGKK